MTALALALLLAQAQAPDSVADSTSVPLRVAVSAAVSVDTVTVGDRFVSFLAVRHAPGVRISFESFPAGDSLQLVDSVRPVRSDSGSTTVGYPLAAWIAGVPLREVVGIVATGPSGERRSYRVALRLPAVRSVLPAEGEIEPRPPKPFFPDGTVGRSWWWLVAAAVAALLVVAALLARWYRKPRVAALPDPRTEALAALDALPEPPAGDAAAIAAHYTAVTRALRRYLARSRAELGEELTTAELLVRVDERGDALDVPTLAALLRQADPVKFGGATAAREEARRFLDRTREWVATNPASHPAARRAA